MSLASTREKRQNAGAKMAKLIAEIEEKQEEEEFYETAYGGFKEIEDDNDFYFKEEDAEDDIIDSDFDADENEMDQNNDENQEQNGDEESKKKRRQGVFTKAYKEPIVKKKEENLIIKKEVVVATVVAEKATVNKENKTLRGTTAQKRLELEQRQKERDAQNKIKIERAASNIVEYSTTEYRRLTQEELLAEAKITEKINLASLDAYQKMELEKKKKSFS